MTSLVMTSSSQGQTLCSQSRNSLTNVFGSWLNGTDLRSKNVTSPLLKLYRVNWIFNPRSLEQKKLHERFEGGGGGELVLALSS